MIDRKLIEFAKDIASALVVVVACAIVLIGLFSLSQGRDVARIEAFKARYCTSP